MKNRCLVTIATLLCALTAPASTPASSVGLTGAPAAGKPPKGDAFDDVMEGLLEPPAKREPESEPPKPDAQAPPPLEPSTRAAKPEAEPPPLELNEEAARGDAEPPPLPGGVEGARGWAKRSNWKQV